MPDVDIKVPANREKTNEELYASKPKSPEFKFDQPQENANPFGFVNTKENKPASTFTTENREISTPKISATAFSWNLPRFNLGRWKTDNR